MRNRLFKFSFLLIFALALVSCHKSDDENSNEKKVYMAGYQMLYYNNIVGMLWENDSAIRITSGDGHRAIATSVFVLNGDVYVSGYYPLDMGDIAMYWKNGVEVRLTDGTTLAKANAIYVVGRDIYVAGYEQYANKRQMAKYWKNGRSVNLTDGNLDANATSVFVSGKFVYVAGVEGYVGPNNHLTHVAKYWKNGIAMSLSDSVNFPYVSSIFVSGKDVYVAGGISINNTRIAAYWKNGVIKKLTEGVPYGMAESIFVSGKDVYVAGTEIYNVDGSFAMCWKNDSAIRLTDGTRYAEAFSVCVADGDVYVGGSAADSNGYAAVYWKNGVGKIVSKDTDFAGIKSITVK
jgi:hypothetical protein